MRDITSLVRQATRSHGLLTTAQMREHGVTKSTQQGLVRAGVFVPVRPGVLRVAGAAVTWRQRLMACVLTPGSELTASHRSALRLSGLRDRFEGLEVSLHYPDDRRLAGVLIHRVRSLEPRDLTEIGGIRTTRLARTLCDIGQVLPAKEVERVTDHAVADGAVRIGDIEEVRRRLSKPGRDGLVPVRRALERVARSLGVESGPEGEMFRLLIDAGLPNPVLQYRAVVGGKRYRIDMAYPDVMLALEYDGRDHHTRVDRFVDDRVRQNDLVAIGWTVLRFTWRDLRDRPADLVARVRQQHERVRRAS